MLQINIVHDKNKDYVSSVIDVSTLTPITTYNEENGKTDFAPLQSHIGEAIVITHHNNDYEIISEEISVLKSIITDEHGTEFINCNICGGV